MTQHTVAVAGATGYAGGEALRILARHPDFDVTTVTGRSSVGSPLGAYTPNIRRYADLVIRPTTPEELNGHDVIIMALPHGASGPLAEKLDPHSVVVDLGADHRLESPKAWADYYGGEFHGPWTYGMPELILGRNGDGAYRRQREALRGATRIAGPGCNVTAVTLALQPAVAEGLIDITDIVADLVVGYSGAGRATGRVQLLAAEALGSASPYGVGGTHRHIPEIVQNLAHAAGWDAAAAGRFRLTFTPVLAPMARGILATVSAPLSARGLALTDAQIRDVWEEAYAGQDFITLLPQGALPATKHVLASNAAHLQVVADRRTGRLIAFAAIDNLCRGTAGQAIQSLNVALGLDEHTGLTKIGVTP